MCSRGRYSGKGFGLPTFTTDVSLTLLPNQMGVWFCTNAGAITLTLPKVVDVKKKVICWLLSLEQPGR